MDSCVRFAKYRLPPQDAFFHILSDGSCSDPEYAQATKVWIAFGCDGRLPRYLLAVGCVALRRPFGGSFVQPIWNTIVLVLYIITPLRVLNGMHLLEFDLISEIEMYHYVENDIRRRISMINTRYAWLIFAHCPRLIPSFPT